MFKFVIIYGGFGFVGCYIVCCMVKEGWCVCVVVCNLNEVLFVKFYGVVGQVEFVFCNICDDVSVVVVMNGVDVVVNCVGILVEIGKNMFDVVQVDGVECVVCIVFEVGVVKLVQIFVIGVDIELESEYFCIKGEGEVVVVVVFFGVVILCFLIIFGIEDGFFNCFVGMICFGLVLLVVGVDMQFQLVWVDDVVQVVVVLIIKDVDVGVYEFGGLDVYIFCEMMQVMLMVIKCCCLILNILFGIVNIIVLIVGVV